MLKRAFIVAAALLPAALALGLVWANLKWYPLAAGAKSDRLLVEKAARRLTLFKGSEALKIYKISLGPSPVGHKEKEGDGRTPEGVYTIDGRNGKSSCHRALHISYPHPQDKVQAARKGVSPGGDIMVHGIRNGLGWLGAFHRAVDWTAGCVAVTDQEMDEIWRAVPNGTTIEIRP